MLHVLLIALLCFQTPQPLATYDKFDDETVIYTPDILVKGESPENGIQVAALRACRGKKDCEVKNVTLAFVFTGDHIATTTELDGMFLIDGKRMWFRFTFQTAKYEVGDTFGQSFGVRLSKKDMIRIVDGRNVACRINGYEFDFTDEQLEQLKSVFGTPKVP